jgi:DNA-binding PadR family transcriptional regulator
MPRERRSSVQTLRLLVALAAQPRAWRHGYELAGETGLPSGTLYPILMRLADRGLLESRWQPAPGAGRPQRHLYRLTAPGLGYAHAQLGAARTGMPARSRA